MYILLLKLKKNYVYFIIKIKKKLCIFLLLKLKKNYVYFY